ncbi:IS66-like element accessory protein TnpA [Marinivivus vitaminiproducens]|uniref:IS66-like element accessory protein TnpA n=1 Tax=Marinivivus vitaminiproducens TaxID=3035935 RepID=UPI002799621D|nr:transposase [Geminicoccaceae bacterium SCSIO 64248]
MAERRNRKTWSDDEKRLICGQTRRPGISVSQVARRYDVNANLVFKWLRDVRFAPDEVGKDEARFLPVEIIGARGDERSVAPGTESRIAIELAGGHCLRVSGAYDPDALVRLIRGLLA